MNKFGKTIRDLRVAQNLSLPEAASIAGILPTYLSRIEQGQDRPPRPDIVRALARVLAADPDVLLRISSSENHGAIEFLHDHPDAMALLLYLKDASFAESEIKQLRELAEGLKRPAN